MREIKHEFYSIGPMRLPILTALGSVNLQLLKVDLLATGDKRPLMMNFYLGNISSPVNCFYSHMVAIYQKQSHYYPS